MQIQKKISVEAAIEVILKYESLNRLYLTDKPFEWIIARLIKDCDEDGTITYNKASRILSEAETSKMPSDANRNIKYYRYHWKKLYLN